MPVQCANCGEELLGSVNRCWRCGQTFVAQKGRAEMPPIRRAPVAPDAGAPAVAEVIGRGPARTQKRIRRGSPFASSATRSQDGSLEPGTASRPFVVRPPGSFAATVGAALSCVLGVISLLVGTGFPAGGMLTAAAGVGMGCWGLTSERRGLATLGLVLCCLALTVAGFHLLIELYTFVYGVGPFETALPADTL